MSITDKHILLQLNVDAVICLALKTTSLTDFN